MDVLNPELHSRAEGHTQPGLGDAHLLGTSVLKIPSHSLPWEFIFPSGELSDSVNPLHFPFKFPDCASSPLHLLLETREDQNYQQKCCNGFLICPFEVVADALRSD